MCSKQASSSSIMDSRRKSVRRPCSSGPLSLTRRPTRTVMQDQKTFYELYMFECGRRAAVRLQLWTHDNTKPSTSSSGLSASFCLLVFHFLAVLFTQACWHDSVLVDCRCEAKLCRDAYSPPEGSVINMWNDQRCGLLLFPFKQFCIV